MLRLTTILESQEGVPRDDVAASTSTSTSTLTLTYNDRRRSRLLVRLDNGEEAALMLPRGTALRDGDRVRGEGSGPTVCIRAAVETLSVARTGDTHLLTRAAYHLGNRHVPLQIGSGWLAYQHDHVLDALAVELGLEVTVDHLQFEPEAGGYRHQEPREAGAGGPHPHPHGLHLQHSHDHDSGR
jgi:urease accessory protein